MTAITDAENRETSFAYDALDRLVGVTDGTGAQTAYAYDAVGSLVSRTNGSGNTTSYEYDLAGRLTGETNAKGETAAHRYDAAGNLVNTTLPSGKEVAYDYDALDRLVEKSYSAGEAGVTYAYSADGDLVSMRDATGDSTFTYDANGRLVSYTNAFSATVGYAYNENGEIAEITYPDGKTVGYAYDALGRMAKVTGRDGGETIYEYDAQDNVTKVTRADGSITTAEYDALGRVETLTNYDGTGAEVSSFAYAYDAAGNRIKEEGPAGTTVYLYDAADRLQSTEGARVSAYTWDADGNLIAQKDGDAAYEYLYDTESRLLAVREGGSLLMSVLYDGLDNRSYGLEYKMIDRHLNQFPHLPGYWNNGQWNCIPDAPDAPKNGKRTAQDDTAAQTDNAPETEAEEQSLWDTVTGWVSGLFGSGPVEKLAKGSGKDDGYTNNGGADNDHGGNGNTNNGNGKPGNNGNGNGSGSGEETSEPISDWARKKLEKLGFTEMDLEMLERLGVTDADARRIVETASVPNTGNGPTHFIPAYDLMFYVNDINRENVELLAQGSRYLSDTAYEYGVQRLAADHEGERETYLYDGRGSVVQLLQGGTVSQSYSYNAYGYINADEYGIHAPFFGYNGEEQNPFTGLQYLRARYYAPQNGGFITQDSFSGILTNALSQNRYTYAENDPVNGIDPSGHARAPGGATKGGGTSKTGGRGSQSGRMSASTGRTSTSTGRATTAAKPAYTTPPAKPNPTSNYQKPSYSSGAARAAQGAQRWSAPSSPAADLMMQTVSDPYLALREATGQWQLPPMAVQQGVDIAKTHVRQSCNPKAGRVASNVSKEDAEWMRFEGGLKAACGLGGMVIAAVIPSPLSPTLFFLALTEMGYGVSDAIEGNNLVTGNGGFNPGRDILMNGDQWLWDAQGTVLDISTFFVSAGSIGMGKAAKAGIMDAPGMLRSVGAQFGKMSFSTAVGGTAGSYVETLLSDKVDGNWDRIAGLMTRFATGLAVYGSLDTLDQYRNFSGVYGVEAINPTVQSSAEAANQSVVSPYKLNPTHSQMLNNRQLSELVKSIEENGIQNPIKYVEFNNNMYVVDGHHRLIAAKQLGLSSVPVEQVTLPYLGYKTTNDLFW